MADELTDALNRIMRHIDQQCYKAMKQVAALGEFHTREMRGWDDDTHSAEESITGYVVMSKRSVARQYSYDKNMNSPRWREAMRHGGGRYHNPPSNYYPDLHDTYDIPDENDAAIICGFVHYLPQLEGPGPVYSTMTFHRSYDMMVDLARDIIANHLKQI